MVLPEEPLPGQEPVSKDAQDRMLELFIKFHTSNMTVESVSGPNGLGGHGR